VSGAEFARRPGLQRLLAMLESTPPFQALIISELSRLGRDPYDTPHCIKKILKAGVRIFSYLDNEEITLHSLADKLKLTVSSIIADGEREAARRRTAEALVRKARAGYVTGGRVFGYDNRPVHLPSVDGRGVPARDHVERVINEVEATVVRRLFGLIAAGYGYKRTARALNDEGAAAPLPRQKGRPRGWTAASVFEVVHRPLYRGEIVYNETQKRNQWGERRQQPRRPEEVVRVSKPELRIASEELWNAARARIDRSRAAYLRGTKGSTYGRPPTGTESKYLLTGLACCGCCGGGLFVRSRSHGRHRAFFYGCATYHNRGKSVCTNRLEVPMVSADSGVLASIEQYVLHPEVIEAAISEAMRLLNPTSTDVEERRQRLRAEISDIESELVNLAAAIATAAGALETLVTAVKNRERRLENLRSALSDLEGCRRIGQLVQQRLQQRLEHRLRDWQGLASRHMSDSRRVLGTLLEGRIAFTPQLAGEEAWYEFAGQASLARVLSGVVSTKGLVAPRGFEPVFQSRPRFRHMSQALRPHRLPTHSMRLKHAN
jgi:DNA invertase Pin-like site-specific DNA recombinase